MIYRSISLFILITGLLHNLQGQNVGAGYSMPATLIANPGVAGVEGDGKLRLSYLNVYPGNSYNLHFLQLSYDGFFEGIHGGVAVFLTNDNRGGVIRDLHGGFSYSYHFRAGDDLYISAGLSASVYHRGFNFNGTILPDQIDPVAGAVLPSNEILINKGVTMPDLSTGFLFMFGRFYTGIAVSHLTQPNISGTAYNELPLNRNLMVHFGGEIDIENIDGVSLMPVAAVEIENEYLSATVGGSVGSESLSISTLMIYSRINNLDVNAGISVSKGGVALYYNYLFNILSHNNILPTSLHHQVGLAIGLYSVDKRKSIRTIIFPKI